MTLSSSSSANAFFLSLSPMPMDSLSLSLSHCAIRGAKLPLLTLRGEGGSGAPFMAPPKKRREDGKVTPGEDPSASIHFAGEGREEWRIMEIHCKSSRHITYPTSFSTLLTQWLASLKGSRRGGERRGGGV